MPQVKLLASSPYSAIQLDPNDPNSLVQRGGAAVEVSEAQAAWIASQHTDQVEFQGFDPQAQAAAPQTGQPVQVAAGAQLPPAPPAAQQNQQVAPPPKGANIEG